MPTIVDPNITIDDARMEGLWANRASVYRTQHEYTIDFIRMDPERDSGIVVARVSFSLALLSDIIEKLEDLWKQYADGPLPEDFR